MIVQLLEKISPLSASTPEYTFLNHKKYSFTSPDHGLIFPQRAMVYFVADLEKCFVDNSNFIIQSENVFKKLTNKLLAIEKCKDIICELSGCQTTLKYIVTLFCKIRLHHFLKEQNRMMNAPHQKRNRKMLTLTHL